MWAPGRVPGQRRPPAELVGEGGLPFRSDEELPEVLDLLVADLDGFRAEIATPSIADGRRPVPRGSRARAEPGA